MTVRLVESLRLFGGRAADCAVYCVRPRFGPALSRHTGSRLSRLGADLFDYRPTNPYPWYQYLNKWLAAEAAERRASTPVLVFLDADVLVLGEPTEFHLDASVDFAGMPEAYSRATGRVEPDEAFWGALAGAVGMPPQDLPYFEADGPEGGGAPTRMYWNGGVIAFRTGMGYPSQVIADVNTALGRRIAHPRERLHFIEQRMIGISAVRRGMRWRQLSRSHNTNVEAWKKTAPPLEDLRRARILHYHNSMEPEGWGWLLGLLKESHPAVHDWLAPRGAVRDDRPAFRRWFGEVLRAWRAARRKSHIRRCTTHGEPPEAVV